MAYVIVFEINVSLFFWLLLMHIFFFFRLTLWWSISSRRDSFEASFPSEMQLNDYINYAHDMTWINSINGKSHTIILFKRIICHAQCIFWIDCTINLYHDCRECLCWENNLWLSYTIFDGASPNELCHLYNSKQSRKYNFS